MTESDNNNDNNNSAGDGNNNKSSSSSSSSEETIEKAFGLLKEAKALESSKEFWNATSKYIDAQQILQLLADEATIAATAAETTTNDGNQEKSKEEHERIAKLYTTKANEYWSHSRQCLIRAMEQEKVKDDNDATKNNGETTLLSLLNDDQAQKRNHTFITLFSRPTATTTKEETTMVNDDNNKEENTASVLDQQWSIEERLQELNKSLPSGFKTSDERMAEINKGLNKLGLSLYTQKEPFSASKFQDTIPKSEDEQIDEIMAQAQDEAALENQQMGDGGSTTMKSKTNKKDDSDDDDDDDLSLDDDDQDEPGDELLEDDQLAIKKIRKKIVKAQIKMVELVAILDEAKAAKDKQYQKEKEVNVNDDDESSVDEDVVASNLLLPGKKKLKSAKRDLKKALLEWEEDLMV